MLRIHSRPIVGSLLSSVLLVVMIWSAPLRAQDILGIKLGDSEAQVRKVLEAAGYAVSTRNYENELYDKTSLGLFETFGNKSMIYSMTAAHSSSGPVADTVGVGFLPPPGNGVFWVMRNLRIPQAEWPSGLNTVQALQKKYGGAGEELSQAGHPKAEFQWTFDSAGKYAPPPKGKRCAPSSDTGDPRGTVAWAPALLETALRPDLTLPSAGSTGPSFATSTTFPLSITGGVGEPSCGRYVWAKLIGRPVEGSLVPAMVVVLTDAALTRDAFLKTRAATEPARQKQLRERLDKANAKAVPKF